jgi:hypothetical protein
MNYIKQMQADNASLTKQLETKDEMIKSFIAHLETPKFTAPGELQGYISTQDVKNYLDAIWSVSNV